ncbi:uncharacterized protein BDZ83DRAFT_155616 [Colletotrichum acutatum]|uniref:Uncharacterized protein n=1 Tax=Glomerella acutata TaxID=27357 RepID=A0AAD8U910_GLOAC|nr:uncharacterized protein BDZ83DRAFT_155616 [Colletotrichum acutatum]KAK1708410.1 hypothetical protein BDZ83DRAFT_155616 [Colletotrichum acutatum]
MVLTILLIFKLGLITFGLNYMTNGIVGYHGTAITTHGTGDRHSKPSILHLPVAAEASKYEDKVASRSSVPSTCRNPEKNLIHIEERDRLIVSPSPNITESRTRHVIAADEETRFGARLLEGQTFWASSLVSWADSHAVL